MRRSLPALGLALVVVVGALWLAVNHLASAGPWVADTARSVLGADAVSRLEDFAYGVDDRWNRWWRGKERPEARWALTSPPIALPAPVAAEDTAAAPVELAEFRPADIGPLFREMAAAGDGLWVPVPDPTHPEEAPLVFKTLLHPDRRRSWAEVFVAAIDLRHTRLRASAGTLEPKASTPDGQLYKRRGVIPEAERGGLLAAFNGGFKAEHGQWGMKIDGVTLLPPRDRGCTVAAYSDDSLRIGTWTALSESEPEMSFWRQTPSCMLENGKLNPGLANEESISWGAALGGGTVVRRSAVGLNPERNVLYMAVSNATTARTLALAMQHAGASDVAQLDINWSYPHFIMFRRGGAAGRKGFVLFDGFAYEEDEYISRSSARDFFYVVRKDSSLTQREK